MGPRQDNLDLLAQAVQQAQHAEAYHAAAVDPAALQGRAAHQAARDAAAMQLIELAGCAEGFARNRGEPGTTLERLDDALRPLFQLRTVHTHPEFGLTPPSLAPRQLGGIMEQLDGALRNLDAETLRTLPRNEVRVLDAVAAAMARIEKDGLPDPGALRPRDLHYAGYYHEIQFGRLAKATGLYDNWGKSPDVRHTDINSSIFTADDMAHRFHAMREGPEKSTLPVSIVSPEHRSRVPGKLLSELVSELRHEYQTPAERLAELEASAVARTREQYREAVKGLADIYVSLTGDPKAAALIRDYVHRQEPPMDRAAVETLQDTLHVIASGGDYLALSDFARTRAIELGFALDEQGDTRLIRVLDTAEAVGRLTSPDVEAELEISGSWVEEEVAISEGPDPDWPDFG